MTVRLITIRHSTLKYRTPPASRAGLTLAAPIRSAWGWAYVFR